MHDNPPGSELEQSRIINSLWPRQNGRLFADDTFKRIFLNENIRISTKNSLNFVPKGLINNIPASVLIMVWRRPGDKPLSEPMLVKSLTHICVTRPQWVKSILLVLIARFLASPSYQQPWYSLWRISEFLSPTRKDFCLLFSFEMIEKAYISYK